MALPPLSRAIAPRTLAAAAATGLSGLIPLHRARGGARAAIIVAPGLLMGGLVGWAFTRSEGPVSRPDGTELPHVDTSFQGPTPAGDEAPKSTSRSALLLGIPVVYGLAISGASALGLAIDGAVERFLVRRGVRRPLLVMAAGGLALGWVTEYLDADDPAPVPADSITP